MKPHYLLTLIFLFMCKFGVSQIILTPNELKDPIRTEKAGIYRGTAENGDTTLYVDMEMITIFPKRVFKNVKEQERFNRMVYNVKKVYPYSLIINDTYREIEKAIDSIKDKKEQKKYIKLKEKELTAKFEKVVREMSFTQGRILIKLVDRQTGETSYEIVKQLKGKLAAIFWQSVARVFSTNLKYEYDSKGEDLWIEEIVAKIENGQL